MDLNQLRQLAALIRYYIITATSAAGSGHLSSSLSAVDLMTVLLFKYFQFDFDQPESTANDRLIFSKGHAAPLLYALYTAAGKITEENLLKMRTFDSNLEGHPSMRFPFTEVPTGSLGQGLSIGVGEALALRAKYYVSGVTCQVSKSVKSQTPSILEHQGNRAKNVIHDTLIHDTQDIPKIYVLLGDGEMAEGAIWEAIQTASYYKLNNLIGIVDVNRLGQSQPTMLGHDIEEYADRITSFGWQAVTIDDGHDLEKIDRTLEIALSSQKGPLMIIAKTVKGKGVSLLEDQENWHGKVLAKVDLDKAIAELGQVDKTIRGTVKIPNSPSTPLRTSKSQILNNFQFTKSKHVNQIEFSEYNRDDLIATRQAFGNALVQLGKIYSDVVVLDGDMKNSTFVELFEKEFPDRFYQMFIAEQNMVGAAMGMAKLGLVPFVSTFGCFLIRAADQIRMAGLSKLHIVFNGSHVGVSIGEDGPSQMGLEEVSLFRTVLNSIVLQGCDAVSTQKLVIEAYKAKGIVYIRTTRSKSPVIYNVNESFPIGKSKILRSSVNDQITLIAAGITAFEALKASDQLKQQGIAVKVIDCYSIKPIDQKTLIKAGQETKTIITIEDHYPVGGLGDAVLEALAQERHISVIKLAVNKIPRSGKPQELLDYEGISASAIIDKVKTLI